MESRLCSIGISIIFFINDVVTVPPDACFANFRWDDCGKPPVPVMYYWKPGSRCEVGMWRGCLPNLNMFQDEYECVSTCIFAVRAMPEDYHNLINDEDDEGLVTSPPVNVSDVSEDAVSSTHHGKEEGITATGDATHAGDGAKAGNSTKAGDGDKTGDTTVAAKDTGASEAPATSPAPPPAA